MPGQIKYNSINIDFENDWVRFNPNLISDGSHVQAASGITQTVKLFEQERISTQLRNSPGQDQIQLQRFFEYANDGSTFELTRNRDLGTYISFEGGGNSALVPTITPRGLQTNDKVAGTFTQTAVANSSWYLDPSTGLQTVVPTTNNIPRFPGGKYAQHGIQIDGARTNDADPDMDPATSSWTATTTTVDDDTTETKAPDGTNTAHKITSTGASGFITLDTGRTVTSNDYAFSAFLKANEATTVSVEMQIRGTGGGTAQLLGPFNLNATGSDGNGFTRYQLNYEDGVDPALTTNFEIRIRIIANARTFYAWCPQGEVGLFASSPIVSSGATRNAENLKFSSTNAPSKGVFISDAVAVNPKVTN